MSGTGGVGSSYGDLLVTSLLVLGGVCIAAFIVVRVVGRLLSTGRTRGAHLLDVVARLPLEPRRALYVVEVAGKTLLVGTSEMGLNVLSELDGGEVRARVAARPTFGELVRAAWSRRRDAKIRDRTSSSEQEPDPHASHVGLAEVRTLDARLSGGQASAQRPGVDPRTSEPRASEPRPSEARASEPRASEPRASEPRASEPRASEPRASEPHVSEPHVSEPRESEPRPSEARASEPRASEPRASEARTSESRASEPRASEPRASEPRASDARASEPRASEPRASEPRASEPRASEPRASESDASGSPPSEARVPAQSSDDRSDPGNEQT